MRMVPENHGSVRRRRRRRGGCSLVARRASAVPEVDCSVSLQRERHGAVLLTRGSSNP